MLINMGSIFYSRLLEDNKKELLFVQLFKFYA
jgi:hypothetical protein